MAWRMYALYRVPSSYISLDAVKLTAQVLKHLSHSCNDATDIGTNQNHSTCRAPTKRTLYSQSELLSRRAKKRIIAARADTDCYNNGLITDYNR